jgi:hypothetical protein
VSTRLDALEPWLVPWASWLIGAYPYGYLTSTRRSHTEQAQLYAAYLRGEARYPAAPPGSSYHEAGRAFDYVAPTAILAQLGALWESVGGRWGGCCKDAIHFEA